MKNRKDIRLCEKPIEKTKMVKLKEKKILKISINETGTADDLKRNRR